MRRSRRCEETGSLRRQLRVGSGASWTGAWILALVGSAAYLLAPDAATWWSGLLLVLPLVLLAAWRAEQKGHMDTGSGVGDAGPWTPPVEGGL